MYNDRLQRLLRESWNRLKISDIWYHGDMNKRDTFCNQVMDRPSFTRDPNAYGPGIYFVNDYDVARGYSLDGGYVYTVRINMNGGRIITDRETVSKNGDILFRLIKAIHGKNAESVWYGVSNYVEVSEMADVTDNHIRGIIRGWGFESLLDCLLIIYREFCNRDSALYIRCLLDVGIIGSLIRDISDGIDYLVMYDCHRIQIVNEERIIDDSKGV